MICLNNAVEFIAKTNILFNYYNEELSNFKLISTKKIALIAKSSLIFFVSVLILTFSLIVNDFLWVKILTILAAVLGFTLGWLALKKSKTHIKKTYPTYEALIGDKLSNYDGDFVKAYRCDMMYSKLTDLKITSSSTLDEIIGFYNRKSDGIKLDRWWPISLAIAIAFPVWNEFISKTFEIKSDRVIFIAGSVFVMSYLSIFANSLLKTFYLSKANKYNGLAETLKMVKVIYFDT